VLAGESFVHLNGPVLEETTMLTTLPNRVSALFADPSCPIDVLTVASTLKTGRD
jgi:hypothetical protein